MNKKGLMDLVNIPLEQLCREANQLRKEQCGDQFDLCTITNGKSGGCTEDCKYCAQSIHYGTGIDRYSMASEQKIIEEALHHDRQGVLRFSIVTSGKNLVDSEMETVVQTYKRLKEKTTLSLCASHGLLTKKQLLQLKEVGVTRYHCNLETSASFFPKICTTHTYEDKIAVIKDAIDVGLSVCSGGIIGMGETMEDRIDMVLTIRELGIQSVPVNILNPIPGTPFEDLRPISEEEILRTVAIFRHAIPQGFIRLAGGRGLLEDKGKQAFLSGANAAISGDMLTTSGIDTQRDLAMLKEIGYKVVKENE